MPLKKVLFRILISTIISFGFAVLISEGSFRLLNGENGRQPQLIEIVVPDGTAERVAQGLPIPSIPEEMIFYEGDQIVVINQDRESHQLGPIWVPAGARGVLSLEKPVKYELACTFQPTNKLGLDVRSRLTPGIRVQGVLAIGLPSAVLVSLFSLVIQPVNSAEKDEEKGV